MENTLHKIDSIFEIFVSYLVKVLFYQIFGIPLIVIVLLVGAITFTLYFKFINIRGFKHAIDIIRGKYDNPNDIGQISHFQALTSALSATIGLGNIAVVAIAVAKGGAGAVFWMMSIAIFSMSAKFVSASLAQLYRKVNPDGSISGGPMYYLSAGLKEIGLANLGKYLAARKTGDFQIIARALNNSQSADKVSISLELQLIEQNVSNTDI